MPTLERSNPLPLYYQLKQVLRQQISAGHLAPHTAIPSEPELVARYRVSRATVRQALTELVHEGLLYRQHGKGTFVCEPLVQQSLSELTSFTEAMRRRGKRADGALAAHQVSYLPYPRAEGVYQRAKELADGSLYSLMAAEGLNPYVVEQTIKSDQASTRESELLHMQAGECGLRITCTTFDSTGAPVEYSESFYPAAHYEFQVTLRVAQ